MKRASAGFELGSFCLAGGDAVMRPELAQLNQPYAVLSELEPRKFGQNYIITKVYLDKTISPAQVLSVKEFTN